jgi:hypothetical protein
VTAFAAQIFNFKHGLEVTCASIERNHELLALARRDEGSQNSRNSLDSSSLNSMTRPRYGDAIIGY